MFESTTTSQKKYAALGASIDMRPMQYEFTDEDGMLHLLCSRNEYGIHAVFNDPEDSTTFYQQYKGTKDKGGQLLTHVRKCRIQSVDFYCIHTFGYKVIGK